jgi:ankyrin repeat protein
MGKIRKNNTRNKRVLSKKSKKRKISKKSKKTNRRRKQKRDGNKGGEGGPRKTLPRPQYEGDPEALIDLLWDTNQAAGEEPPDINDVKSLIENGINVKWCDPFGFIALHYASDYGYTNIVKALINAEPDDTHIWMQDTSVEGTTALYRASKNGHLNVVKELIKVMHDRKDIWIKDNRGYTALHVASGNGHLDVVNELIKVMRDRKDIWIKDGYGYTALHVASENGHLDVVNKLIAYGSGAHIRMRDNAGNTALHMAALDGYIGVSEALINADPTFKHFNIQNTRGDTALHLALLDAENGINFYEFIYDICKTNREKMMELFNIKNDYKDTIISSLVKYDDEGEEKIKELNIWGFMNVMNNMRNLFDWGPDAGPSYIP